MTIAGVRALVGRAGLYNVAAQRIPSLRYATSSRVMPVSKFSPMVDLRRLP
jgi:hypothetical protein